MKKNYINMPLKTNEEENHLKFMSELQTENQELKTIINSACADINSLFSYIQSSKFHDGGELAGYVHISDIFNRLAKTRMNLIQSQ